MRAFLLAETVALADRLIHQLVVYGCVGLPFVLAYFVAPNNHVMHFIRTVCNSQRTLSSVHAREWGPLGHTCCAVYLYRLIDNVAHFLGHHGFDGADVYACFFIAQGVHRFGSLQNHQTTCIDFDASA